MVRAPAMPAANGRHGRQASSKADVIADQIRDLCKQQGLPDQAAFGAMSDFYRRLAGNSPESESVQTLEIHPTPNRMKAPGRKQARVIGGQKLTRFALPEGNGWVARVSRGLSRWRESRKLTIPVAAKKFSLNQTAWYRIERGNHPATTAGHIDDFCKALKIDLVELLKLGE